MRFGAYLRSSLSTVAVWMLAILLCVFILDVSRAGGGVTALVAIVLICALMAALAIDYFRKRPFFCDLERCATDVEHPLWITEIIERPECIEGEIAYDALQVVSKVANDDVARCQRQVSDYREYIETWVHEAKSPLAASHLILENLRDEPEAGVSARKLASLDGELRRVEGYVEQALFYARSETVDRDYLIRKYRLGQLVAASLKANAPALIAAHAAPIQENLDLEVFTDEKWMEFIFGQIIQNSVKYADKPDPTILFSARLVDEGLAGECVELTVRDNGCGVAAADVPRVFEKGFTGDNGRMGKRSTGIGLYLVKRLCDKMGVRITAASVEGEWFALTLSFSMNKFRYFE